MHYLCFASPPPPHTHTLCGRWRWLGVTVFVVAYSYLISISLPFFTTLVRIQGEKGRKGKRVGVYGKQSVDVEHVHLCRCRVQTAFEGHTNCLVVLV
jgi:hypothetical protein